MINDNNQEKGLKMEYDIISVKDWNSRYEAFKIRAPLGNDSYVVIRKHDLSIMFRGKKYDCEIFAKKNFLWSDDDSRLITTELRHDLSWSGCGANHLEY